MIAVHAFALLLLLIPMATPVIQAVIDDRPDVFIIEAKKQVVEETVIDKRPTPVTETKPTPKVMDKPVPITDPPVIVEGGSVASSQPSTPDTGPLVAAPGPMV
ncbi:MAG TPA: hypothetical protein VET30_05215, partial [Pseudoxanthomonas sp.]|nr:hypothetical protein [Pseudoxanthomonas sp.]